MISLRKRAAFLRLQKEGRRWVSKGLILQVSENDLGEQRLGLTVSKRLSKSAVKRNRMRRRLREAARAVLPLYGRGGADYVLIGRTETAERPWPELVNDLKWCLKKLEFYVAP